MTDQWVRLHLVNIKLGGKGIGPNLVPGPKTVNSQMEQYAENPLKASLGQTREGRKNLKHQTVLWVESRVSYHSGTTPHNGKKYHWAKSVVVKGGFHFYDPGKKKWVKEKKPAYVRAFGIPVPRKADKPAVSLKSASRVSILELDFDSTSVNRGFFKSQLDLNLDAFLKYRSQADSFQDFEDLIRENVTTQSSRIMLSLMRRLTNNPSKTVATWN